MDTKHNKCTKWEKQTNLEDTKQTCGCGCPTTPITTTLAHPVMLPLGFCKKKESRSIPWSDKQDSCFDRFLTIYRHMSYGTRVGKSSLECPPLAGSHPSKSDTFRKSQLSTYARYTIDVPALYNLRKSSHPSRIAQAVKIWWFQDQIFQYLLSLQWGVSLDQAVQLVHWKDMNES